MTSIGKENRSTERERESGGKKVEIKQRPRELKEGKTKTERGGTDLGGGRGGRQTKNRGRES